MESPTTAVRQEKNQSGEPFDVRHQSCKFHPADIVDAWWELKDGPKRVYRKLCRLASRTGCAYGSAAFLSSELGKSVREIKRDLAELRAIGLIRSARHGRAPNSFEFLRHDLFSKGPMLAHQEPASNATTVSHQEKPLKGHFWSSKGPDLFSKGPTLAHNSDQSENQKKEAVRKARRVVAKPAVSGESQKSPKTSSSVGADDDEKLPPEQRFILRMRARHGEEFDAQGLLKIIKSELEKSGFQLSDWLSADAVKTTAPEKLKNPAGHYRKIAKDLAADAHVEALPLVGPSIDIPRCQVCKAGRLEGGYCTCPTGRDLERVEGRVNGNGNGNGAGPIPGKVIEMPGTSGGEL